MDEDGMQGSPRPNRELLDAAALCPHQVPEGRRTRSWLIIASAFPDEMFAYLFGSGRERPSVPAYVVATVMVLQAFEVPSDREAVRQFARTWRGTRPLGWR